MTAKYFALLTTVGAAKLANAAALGSELAITTMAVGDANGAEPTPNPAQTKLINECHRAPLNSLRVDAKNPSQVIAEQVLAETIGGWWIREIGLYDAGGDLIAVGNCPPSYKPLMAEGSGRDQIIRMILIVSSSDAVELKIDPSVVLATREYVDDAIETHAKTRNHPDASTTAKGLAQLSSATNSTSETLAATPKAVKAAYDLAHSKLSSVPDATTTAKGVVQLSSVTNSTSETLAATPKAVKVVQDAVSDLNKLTVKTVNTHKPDASGNVKLGTAADANLGKDLPGQVLTVGNYGLANTLAALDSTDLNTLQTFGFYVVRNASNAPINDVGVLYVSVQSWNSGPGGDASRAVQTVYSYTNKNRSFCRTYFGPSSGWSGWVEFFSEAHKPTSADVDLGNVGNFMAVQQGGVSNQGANKLHIGWGTDGKLRLTVDQSDQGLIFTTNSPPPYPVTSVNGHAGAVSLNDGFSTDNTSMWWDAFSSQLRIQVGTWSIGAPAGASTTVAFPKAFPNWCLFAVPVPDSSVASSAATEQIGVGGRTNTTVTFSKGIGDSSARGGKYLAFGF